MQFKEEMLTAYLDNELSSEDRQVVEATIGEKPEYAKMLADLQEIRDAVRALPPIKPAQDPVDAVRRRIDSQSPSPTDPGLTHESPLARWAGLAVAACLMLGIGTYLFRPSPLPSDSIEMAGNIETEDAQIAEDIAATEEAEAMPIDAQASTYNAPPIPMAASSAKPAPGPPETDARYPRKRKAGAQRGQTSDNLMPLEGFATEQPALPDAPAQAGITTKTKTKVSTQIRETDSPPTQPAPSRSRSQLQSRGGYAKTTRHYFAEPGIAGNEQAPPIAKTPPLVITIRVRRTELKVRLAKVAAILKDLNLQQVALKKPQSYRSLKEDSPPQELKIRGDEKSIQLVATGKQKTLQDVTAQLRKAGADPEESVTQPAVTNGGEATEPQLLQINILVVD